MEESGRHTDQTKPQSYSALCRTAVPLNTFANPSMIVDDVLYIVMIMSNGAFLCP